MNTVFEHIVQTPNIKYKHAKGMRDIFGKEFHHFHEIFLFIGGDARFITENKTVTLRPYTLVVIPENTFHCFHVEGDEADYERYLFNFHSIKSLEWLIDRNMKDIAIIESLPQNVIDSFTSLDCEKYSNSEKELLINANLTSVIVELGHLIPNSEDSSSEHFSEITSRCLRYINRHVYEKISVKKMAKDLNYSVSSITHTFKAEMHLPVYTYITEKKMISAHNDIRNGMNATEAGKKYGFSDYSSFYRLYKKQFGVSPSGASHSRAPNQEKYKLKDK